MKGTLHSKFARLYESKKLSRKIYNQIIKTVDDIIDKYNLDPKYQFNNDIDITQWAMTEIDDYLYNLDPLLFKIPLMYSERYYEHDSSEYEKKQKSGELIEVREEMKKRVQRILLNEVNKGNITFELSTQLSNYLQNIIEIQPISILQNKELIKKLLSDEMVIFISNQPSSSS